MLANVFRLAWLTTTVVAVWGLAPSTLISTDNTLTACGERFVIYQVPQPISHFSAVSDASSTLFSQRVLVSRKYFDRSNPVVLFYAGNEGTIELFAANTCFMAEAAAELKAAIVFAEHRYFGESLPFGEAFMDHLEYLTAEETLADFAGAITLVRSSLLGSPDAAVISFGGSYGGMLAAWLRVSYPDIFAGAIAGSAPVLVGNTPPAAFNDVLCETFESAMQGCCSATRKLFDTFAEATLSSLTTTFRLCDPLSDRDALMKWLGDGLTYEAVADYPYRADFLGPIQPWPVNATCSIVSECASKGVSDLDCLAAAVQPYFNGTGLAGQCFDVEDSSNGRLGDTMWDYLACTEMVFPIASSSNSLFPFQAWDMEAYASGCKDRWNVTPDPHWVDKDYSISKFAQSSNIVFSNGALDPWRSGGIVTDLAPTVRAIVIASAAHHLDLRGASALDPVSVVKAREFHMENMRQWIAEHQAAAAGETVAVE